MTAIQFSVRFDELEVIHRALRALRSFEAFNETCLHATADERAEARRTLNIIDGLVR